MPDRIRPVECPMCGDYTIDPFLKCHACGKLGCAACVAEDGVCNECFEKEETEGGAQ